MWFRPEVVRTVAWGGDPRKAVSASVPGAPARLHPRASFDKWKELVRGRAEPWRESELAAAADFRRAVLDLVLHRAEERAQMSDELQRSNRELEAFSYSVSHDLRAPFRHIVGYAELLGEREDGLSEPSRRYLTAIRESALSAGRLVDDLLAFSRLGRASLSRSRVDMAKLMEEVRRSLEPEWRGREVEWRIAPLPPAYGDPSMLRQVLLNLVDNALKYSRHSRPAVIGVSSETSDDHIVFKVEDNGVGFDMAYVDKLFGVFQRLHRAEEFEGTGIGLALARRIVERHDGAIWAEGRPREGAAFRFSLPRRPHAAASDTTGPVLG
jgi:light-regulated signal transduction histidine kinase (bacteriophytochrome)